MNAFFLRALSVLKRLRSDADIDPVRDWLVMLLFSTVAFLGVVVWNVWAFETVARGGVIGAPAPAVSPIFDRTALDAARAVFAARAAERAKYETGAYRLADPSQ